MFFFFFFSFFFFFLVGIIILYPRDGYCLCGLIKSPLVSKALPVAARGLKTSRA